MAQVSTSISCMVMSGYSFATSKATVRKQSAGLAQHIGLVNHMHRFASRLAGGVECLADDSLRAFAGDDSFSDGAVAVIFKAFDA